MIERYFVLSSFCAVLILASGEFVQQDILQFHPEAGNSSLLSRDAMINLKGVLDYVCDSSGFHRFSFSIISTYLETDISELISRYVSDRAFKSYQAEIEDFLRNCTWKNESDLTWIFLVDNLDTLHAIVRREDDLWKSRSQYIIIYTNQKTAVSWEDIFKYIWSNYNVYRVIVTSIQNNFEYFMGFSPFEFVGNTFGSVHKLRLPKNDDENFVESKKEFNSDFSKRNFELFDDLRDLRGYELKVMVFSSLMMEIQMKNGKVHFSKLDADIMKSLEKGMKAKFNIKILGRSNRTDPFDEALRHLEYHRSAEMILTSFFAKPYERHNRFEFTTGSYEDVLCLIAPDAGLVPKYYMPVFPFRRDLWFLIIFTNLIVTILWLIIRHYSRLFRNDKKSVNFVSDEKIRKLNGIFFPVTSVSGSNGLTNKNSNKKDRPCHVAVELGIEDHPKNVIEDRTKIGRWCLEVIILSCYPLTGADTAAQRTFLLSTLFFGMIITNLYQSGLVSTLSEPLHYPQLGSLEDVANSNFTIVTKYENLIRGTFDGATTISQKLRKKSRLITSTTPTLDLVAFQKVIAIGRYSSFKLEDLSAYYDEDGNGLLHVVPDYPATYMLSYAVKLYSPYLERINELLLRMQEAGLVELWYEDMLRTVRAQEQRRKAMENGRRRKLSFQHYSLTFLGLFLGLLGCTFVFLVELYYARKIKLNCHPLQKYHQSSSQ